MSLRLKAKVFVHFPCVFGVFGPFSGLSERISARGQSNRQCRREPRLLRSFFTAYSHLKPKALGFGALRLLESFLDTFHDEPLMVQMQLLTAIVKLFLQKPSSTQDMAARL